LGTSPGKQRRKESYQESRQRKREEERLRRRVVKAEEEVMALEARREAVRTEMLDPALATDSARLGELAAETARLEQGLQKAITEWERLAGRLDAFLDGATP
jgi:ATP-binding cassette subfamily F protein 3